MACFNQTACVCTAVTAALTNVTGHVSITCFVSTTNITTVMTLANGELQLAVSLQLQTTVRLQLKCFTGKQTFKTFNKHDFILNVHLALANC